jgi:hypothetical protein
MRDQTATGSFVIPRTEMVDDDDGRQMLDHPAYFHPYVVGNEVSANVEMVLTYE